MSIGLFAVPLMSPLRQLQWIIDGVMKSGATIAEVNLIRPRP